MFLNIIIMKYTIASILFMAFINSCQSDGDTNQIENQAGDFIYQSTNDVFANPERGFMHTWQVFSEGSAMSTTALANLKNENVSIVLRFYYLEKFKTTALSQLQLDLIKTDFERLRNAGLKCVLRFAYTDTQNGTDASLTIIQQHLDQLKPIVTDNADVIAFVQAGFIGAWGEWYYTTNGLTTIENQKAVLNKLLEVFPANIKIQVRTPKIKKDCFSYSNAMGSNVGYGITNIARVGYHNDCFLASVDDYGTYENITADKTFISDEAVFVPTGGETCPPTGVPTASCTTAETEMTLLKWTYLNLDYYGPVLQEWRNNNCFTDFERKLGYRLALQSSNLKTDIALNGEFDLNLIINNVGFAPVYNQKNTYLIFRSVTDGTVYKKKLNFDIRYVKPKVSYQLTEAVSTANIPAGKYDLLLKMEDTATILSDRPEYCIRLANNGLWETTTGFNKLSHSLTIK
jgi:hypothetical protein